MANDAALTINRKHLDLHLRRHHAAGEFQRMAANFITEGNARRTGHRQRLLTGVRPANGLLQRIVSTNRRCPFRQLRQVDTRMTRVQVHVPGRQFADLTEAAAQAEFLHRYFAGA